MTLRKKDLINKIMNYVPSKNMIFKVRGYIVSKLNWLLEISWKNIMDVYPSKKIMFYRQSIGWIKDYKNTFLTDKFKEQIDMETLDEEMKKINKNKSYFSEDVQNAYDELIKSINLYKNQSNTHDKQGTQLEIINKYDVFEKEINKRINILYIKQGVLFVIIIFSLAFKINININL